MDWVDSECDDHTPTCGSLPRVWLPFHLNQGKRLSFGSQPDAGPRLGRLQTRQTSHQFVQWTTDTSGCSTVGSIPRDDGVTTEHLLQQAKVIHFMGDDQSGARTVVHFYAFLFFENWKHVRDHLRYADEIQCAAARMVQALRDISRRRRQANQNDDHHHHQQQQQQQHAAGGAFDSLHIRRGDFRNKKAWVGPGTMFNVTFDVLIRNSTLYIATDERNMKFFAIFKEH